MSGEKLTVQINDYLHSQWETVLDDIASLVRIESVEDLSRAQSDAPFGPGPRQALDQALSIARRMGFAVCDCEGYLGYADFQGESDTQIGIIGHVDVVPAGPGWTFEPYEVTKRDGYLLGRGVIDDKGPIIVALHAVKFWRDVLEREGKRFPYTVRVLFGANEETNMKDVSYYRNHHSDPAFLITPDAEFPVCYGEAGICSGTLTSAPLHGGVVRRIDGGIAVNAVPGQARATLHGCYGLKSTENVRVETCDDGVTLHAQGKSAHASTPELGENAIDILADYLLKSQVLSEDEEKFFKLVRLVTSRCDGSLLGVDCADEHFGALTAVGGTIAPLESAFQLSIDFRYPTTTSAAAIEARVRSVAAEYGATFAMAHDKEPFLMNPASDAVQALLAAYNETTGENAQPFTMKGGTYARVFSTGVSFGPEKPWEQKPPWVGGMHGPDEGVSEALLKQAFEIYVRTIGRLMELDLR